MPPVNSSRDAPTPGSPDTKERPSRAKHHPNPLDAQARVMSAYIVDKSQIDVLVAAGAQIVGEESTPDHLSAIGQHLLDECVRSVAYRYSKPGRVIYYGAAFAESQGDDDLGDLPGMYDRETIPGSSDTIDVGQWLTPYTYRTPAEPINRESVSDEIGCYEYQSCEHPEWDDSWAHDYCIGLRAQLANLPAAPEPEREPEPSPDEFRQLYGDLSRSETIKRIRDALKRRSGKSWSVTGGRGTAYGWILIQSPPKRRTGKHVQKPGAAFGEYEHVDTGEQQEFGIMTPADCQELAALLGKDRPVHHQGESIPSGSDYYREYIDRAEGRTPANYGTQYWD